MSIVELHPENPQPRLVQKVVECLQKGGIIAYPTDSGYAFGCCLRNKEALERIKKIRQLDDKHDFTLVLSSFGQIGQYVIVDNTAFKLINRATPGPYTFILKGTKEVPKLMLNAKKQTVGARIPDSKVVRAILESLGEPLVSSTLLIPGEDQPLSEGWIVAEKLGRQVDLVVDSEVSNTQATTVLEIIDGEVTLVRLGAGDISSIGIDVEE